MYLGVHFLTNLLRFREGATLSPPRGGGSSLSSLLLILDFKMILKKGSRACVFRAAPFDKFAALSGRSDVVSVTRWRFVSLAPFYFSIFKTRFESRCI